MVKLKNVDVYMRSKKKQTIGITVIFLLLFNLTSIGTVISEQPSILFGSESVQQDTFGFREYRAVLVGIDRYQSSVLPYSVKQLKGFETTLLNGGNWKESNVRSLTDSRATKTAILNNIMWLEENADNNDVSLFYFIGHGGRNLTNECIISHNKPIYDTLLNEYFINISGKVIILIDACYSGGLIEDLKGPDRIIITACKKDEVTYQVQDLQSGMFGYFFNMSLAWFSKNAEHTYLFTKIFTWYYGKKLSEKYEEEYAIHPQLYDGSFGRTLVIYKHSYIKNIINMMVTISSFSGRTKFWRMENTTLTSS